MHEASTPRVTIRSSPDEGLEARLMARLAPGVHARLKSCRVGIAGCGGLGSNLAVMLARSGIGALTLVDHDRVEESNLNRQHFFLDQLGQEKVEALRQTLSRINPFVGLDIHCLRLTSAHLPQLFEDCQAVAECFDDPVTKAELSRAMRRHLPKIPLVGASGIAGSGPASHILSRRAFSNHFVVGDATSEAGPDSGLLASRVMIAAGQQAHIIVRWLIGAIDPTEEE